MILTPANDVILSPNDLMRVAACEFSYLRSLDARLGRVTISPREDAMRDRLIAVGRAHEERVDARLRADNKTFVRVGRPSHSLEAIQAAADSTRRRIDEAVDVIAQATLFDGELFGIADYLIRKLDGSYAVWEAKSGTNVHDKYVIQLAAYAALLDGAGISRADRGGLFLRDRDQPQDLTEAELAPVGELRGRARTISLHRLSATNIVDWADASVAQCGKCDDCIAAITSSDDIWQVFNLRRSDRDKLRDAGLPTMTKLAQSSGDVAGMKPERLATFRAQAALQLRHGVDASGRPVVAFEVFDRTLIDSLPAPDDGDLFFDFEGDTMHVDSDGSFGLEYLWGLTTANGDYQDWWADDRVHERTALSDFLDFVVDRRAAHPAMHVYHFGSYETSRLSTLAHHVHAHRVAEVDRLIADGVFVDLSKVVTKSIRVSAGSYGLKALEPLFRDARVNDSVANAVDSITAYATYCSLRDAGDAQAAAESREAVIAYNADDCRSTHLLRDWLCSHSVVSA